MLETIMANHAAFWIGMGFLFLAIETLVFGFATGVLLFGSLGAIVTGVLLWFSIVDDNFITAVACFAISTAAITGILWSPLKRLQSGGELGKDRSSDLIGHTFRVSEDVSADTPGSTRYSGISWRVEFGDEFPGEQIAAGTQVRVTAVSVGVFYVEPISSAA